MSNIYGDVTVFKGVICIDCINCIKCNGFEGTKSAIVFIFREFAWWESIDKKFKDFL